MAIPFDHNKKLIKENEIVEQKHSKMNFVTIMLIAFLAALHLGVVEATEGGTRNMKTSKEPKKVKETKKPVDPKKCAVVKNYSSDGSFLANIISSMFKSQDFSSYCQVDFDVAKKWFLDVNNHPQDGKQKNFEYMTVRGFYYFLLRYYIFINHIFTEIVTYYRSVSH